MSQSVVWSAWAAGAGIGIYAFVQRWVTNEALGCSSAFGNICARMGSRLPLFRSNSFSRASDWRIWFLVGIFLGGLVANFSGGGWSRHEELGSFYQALLPASTAGQVLWWLFGGVLIGTGARLAGGCTSGHTIAGVAVGAPASIVASALFFAGAVGVVQALHWFVLPLLAGG